MYGLPADFTGQPFVGSELRSVSVFSNQLVFDFNGERWLRLESAYACAAAGGPSISRVYRVPHFEPKLMRVLDRLVVLVAAAPNGALQLTFDNGDRLTFYDDDPRYEAYHLGWPGFQLTV